MKPAIYIAGPMRGQDRYNFPVFYLAAASLQQKGWTALNPAEVDEREGVVDVTRLADGTIRNVRLSKDFDFAKVFDRDLEMVRSADAIVMLPGWEKSEGAKKEHEEALYHGLDIYYGVAEVPVVHSIPDSADRLGIPTYTHADGSRVAFKSAAERDAYEKEFLFAQRYGVGQTNLVKEIEVDIEDRYENDPAYGYGVEEVRVKDPWTGGEKGRKAAQLGAVDPKALLEVGNVAGFGAEKYDRYNFLKGYAWSLSFDALLRHLLAFWAGEDRDPESGQLHTAHAAWHCLALISFAQRGLGTDDRPPRGED